MPALDIFSSSAFTMVALTDAINKMPYVPGRIGQLGLFREQGVSTTSVMIEEREGKVFVDSTRAGGATVVAAYSPRIRPGVPVSFPVSWDDLTRISPSDFTIRTAPELLAGRDPWVAAMPEPQALPEDLVEEGRAIPIARVAAMHEGKRRKSATRNEEQGS